MRLGQVLLSDRLDGDGIARILVIREKKSAKCVAGYLNGLDYQQQRIVLRRFSFVTTITSSHMTIPRQYGRKQSSEGMWALFSYLFVPALEDDSEGAVADQVLGRVLELTNALHFALKQCDLESVQLILSCPLAL